MTTRSERDKHKGITDKNQAVLSQLLKEEDNKYCVDCDAKGPRWASWNLGVFLCIRCAGIHRNLGVHISKVKSVNLDTWTSEQLAMMQEMGNSRARAAYEANLPDHFRRPQTDSSLEAFIRAKYETKKYLAKEWIPPKPKVQPIIEEKVEKKKSRPRPKTNIQLSATNKPSSASTVRTANKPLQSDAITAKTNSPPAPSPAELSRRQAAIDDLLGLDDPPPEPVNSAENDLFGEFLGTTNGTMAPSGESPAKVSTQQTGDQNSISDLEPSLFGENGEKKSTKESILALYGSSSNQQRFGVPGGVYMAQQGTAPAGLAQQQMNMMPQGGAAMQNGMMGMQPNMMNMQQQPNMMMNAMGAGMPGGMPSNNAMQMGMQGSPNMYNMAAPMYNMQQQAQLQQMQQQMAAMSMGNPGMGTYVQPAGGVSTGSWGGGAPQGHTLATNLWQ